MRLAKQLDRLLEGLPPDWSEAALRLAVTDEGRLARTSVLLGPLAPGRRGQSLLFHARRGDSALPELVRRTLARLDEEGIRGHLELLGASETVAVEPDARPALAEAWDALVAGLPPDWSDVYAELELTSSDHLDPVALALAPLNPLRYGATPGFRFRCARRFGYGAAPGMVRRCLERLDERGFPGQLRILRALSGTRPVETQGPVWYLGGRVV